MKICFTGRRPKDLCGYDKEKYKDFVTDLSRRLYDIAKENAETEFISGGAQGFDQMAFWAVNILKRDHPELNVTNTVYVPFKGQERKWADKGLFSKAEYNMMLREADNINYLKEKTFDTKEIIGALLDRNHKMVDNSDLVIALFPNDDWKKPETRGGTAECMKYADKKNKDILRVGYTLSPVLTITEMVPAKSESLEKEEPDAER
jgi:uncharacterized phage-like protein YoqJ